MIANMWLRPGNSHINGVYQNGLIFDLIRPLSFNPGNFGVSIETTL